MTSETVSSAPRNACLIDALPDLDSLPPDIVETMQAAFRTVPVAAGRTIAEAGERTDVVGFVRRGILRMQKTLYDGRQHIVGLLVEGDMFGRVFDGPTDIAMEAATDADLCICPRAEFERLLLRSPELDRLVLLNILNELDRARDWMILLANPRVRGRLAGFLLILCTRFAGIDHILQPRRDVLDVLIPLGRTDLSHLLGTRPESISRAFHALADDGIIGIRRPDLVEIRDMDALAMEAGEDDSFDYNALSAILKLRSARRG